MQQMSQRESNERSLPLDKSLLDRISNQERFAHYYDSFVAAEKALISDRIFPCVPHGRVLNVGCAANGVERTLFPVSHYEIFGVDINAEDLRNLQQKKLYDGLYRANIVSLPFHQNSIDIIYLRLVLHHLVYPDNILRKGLQECFRVLRSGGILALVEPNSWHPVGAAMNAAHKLGFDMYIHGTDDDVALSPLTLRGIVMPYSSQVSGHAVTYSWRRLPIPLQTYIDRTQRRLRIILERLPYFGHTLMMIAHKR